MNVMEGQLVLLLPVIVPIGAGLLILLAKAFRQNRSLLVGAVLLVLAVETALVLLALGTGKSLAIWRITDVLTLDFQIDSVSRIFALLTVAVWSLAGLYAVSYMSHEQEERRFFGFYLIVLGVLIALDFAGNLITLYVFYELMTLTSLPLVLHERTREASMAGLKYLFYSVAGAFLALFGILFLASVSDNLAFVAGGMPDVISSGKRGLLLAAVFCMLVGFGAKAGMFPLHGWLPTAHPVAPVPASALLSGVITKAGVLAVIRVVYFVVGAETIRGTWVQDGWILLSLMTVFMGSLLAYKEPLLKKRLAYSTVSQVSYILFGLSMLQPIAFVGALSHVIFHSLIKNALFLCAGAMLLHTGKTKVEDMAGLGRDMPLTLGCFTIVSLALIGIPPASGFVSKWYLAVGALASGTGAWAWIGPVVLLVSALLTAGYLLPLTIQGFFPGTDLAGGQSENGEEITKPELSAWMLIPVLALTAGSLLLGCFPGRILAMLKTIASAVL